MTNLETPNSQETSTADLLASFESIGRMPEALAAEAKAKLQAYNDAIIALERRLPMTHNESMSDSLDDGSQEETADAQERDVIGQSIAAFRREMSRLHEVVVKLEA